MTTQQVKGLHPFVYPIKVLDLLEYPDLSTVDVITYGSDNTYGVDPSLDIYGTQPYSSNSNQAALMKLQRMDIHEHYFTIKEVEDSSFDKILYTPGSYQAPGTDSSITINPITKSAYYCGALYVMAICKNPNLGVDLSSNTTIMLQKFVPLTSKGDISMHWQTLNLDTYLDNYDPTHYSTYDLHGMFGVSGEDYVYTYMHDACGVIPKIFIQQIDRTDGTVVSSQSITNVGASINELIIDKPSASEGDLFLTIGRSDGLWLGTVSFDIDTSTTSLQKISGASIITKPATYPYIDSSSGTGTQLIIYAEPGRGVDKLYLAEAQTSVAGNVKTFDKPYTYTIDQTSRFNNTDIDFNEQVYFDFASTRNPLNKDIIYVAYFTSLGYIRVVKLYKYLPAGSTRNIYVILWATRADSTGSAFMVSTDEYVRTSTAGNALHIVTDNVGDLYIFARQVGGQVYIWKLREYLLDLGHSQISDVTASPNTMTTFLADIEADYSSQAEGVYFGFLPKLSDVVFDSITSGTTIDIVFKYINNDVFKSGIEDADGKTVADRFVENLIDALTTLYENSNITVINLDSTVNNITTTASTVTVQLPKGTAIKPCVLRGTEVPTYRKGKVCLQPIQNVHEGDYVMNQQGLPVKVIRHTNNVIITNSWTTPHMIPVGYFGKDQPYKRLFISGDHGILRGNKKLYPYKMQGAFRRVPINSMVEYHHLMLENPQINCFFANGVLVESLREGVYMT